jgi:hypothetical protein
VEWNGSPRSTTVVSATQLAATIYASDIATEGTAQITVVNPGNGGGTSSPLTFTIGAPAPPPPPAAPVVTLGSSTLTFAAQTVAVASAAQTISLKNTGNADLNGVKIAVTGTDAASFAETDNCGTAVAAGSACTVSVVFTPAVAGALSATITITDNAAGSPQSVALSGTGTAAAPTFTITQQPGGSSSATVSAGKPATYSLALSPSAGYSGNITLSCSGLPANAVCSFSPATVAISGGKAAGFMLTIATETTQSNVAPALGAALAGLLLLLPLCKGRRPMALAVSIGLVLVIGGVSGCGGGGGCTAPTQPTSPTVTTVAPGTYTIQVVASDGTTTQKMAVTLVVAN